MRVPAPTRLAQLAHLFSVNTAAVFGNKNTLTSSLRRHHQNPFDIRPALPSPTSTSTSTNTELSSSSESDPTFDAEMVPDDRTLVESRRHSSHSDAEDEADSVVLFSDPPEDEVYLKLQRMVASSRKRRQPASSSGHPDTSARLSIIYPLPNAESLLTHEPTPSITAATVIDGASIDPPLCTSSPLSPPPAHYKRRRAHIMSDEDHGPDLNQTAIRLSTDPESTLRFPF
ncbi:hypothetical protein DFH94DRAFT_213487 [Russula ochroleuca]|uniref:Uncharacterized protein n=1 Tax=Russula ochroleuca TaxID=152965 RepID=A0A9P5MQS1_9AGAM|nr:hypothetical protein DFH94DRAFT_213487 [Russula ochroleuca]